MAASDAFYIEIRDEVDAVLDELGTTYTVRTPGEYDPDELETGAGSTRTVGGLVADQQTVVQLVGDQGANWIGKKTLILKASSAPKTNEEVQVDGNWFPLSKLVPIKPADIIVVYMLDVTR